MRQQLAIQDELERRRREDPLVETFFTRSGAEPFFVKNLENIQGDERDVIFISVTYGPGTDGRIRYNFGPLNGENGWRRLNVLVTRARQRMRVFSSMRGEDINPAGSVSNGPSLLRAFLTFAEHGRLEGKTVTEPADAESLFEREVLTELVNRGVRVVPQVGASGYRIDIGVLDNDVQGRFLCGIECDGVAYHSSETARDRDRLRQQVLEARGWTIHRVWSTDWFKDRKGQIERLLRMIETDRGRARDEHKAAAEALVHLEAEAQAEQRRNRGERTPDNDHERASPGPVPYDRPLAPGYVTAGGEGQYANQDILIASDTVLTQAVRYVVDTESPVHREDAVTRVAGMWSTRVGSRVRTCIEQACERAQRNRLVRRRGDFLWNASDECVPRSRAGMRVAADRIAPEEYRATVIAVLGAGHSFPQATLITEVRSILGFNRTGWQLEEAIRAVLEAMLRDGTLGEGSAGLRLRQTDPAIRHEA